MGVLTYIVHTIKHRMVIALGTTAHEKFKYKFQFKLKIRIAPSLEQVRHIVNKEVVFAVCGMYGA